MEQVAPALPLLMNELAYIMEEAENQPAEVLTRIEKFLKEAPLNLFDYSEVLMADLMVNALRRKLIKEVKSNRHLYLKTEEVPQIELFDILIHKFPFVKYSQLLVNNNIVKDFEGKEEVTLMDIGMGMGTQTCAILELCKKLPSLKKINIIGIEPFAQGLETAGIAISQYKEEVAFEINFTPVNAFAEETELAKYYHNTPNLVVNASLALHHIKTLEARSKTLAAIQQLAPLALYLIEPNSNHFEPNLSIRYKYCYNHYLALFKVIDQMNLETKYKNALKLFFGREIEDVIGNEESHRVEKHSLAEYWLETAQKVGFTHVSQQMNMALPNLGNVTTGIDPQGYFAFTVDTEKVLAIFKFSA